MSTKIEWTDETWNPIRGCSRVSEGCRNCYAEKVAYRFSGERLDGKPAPYKGLVQRTPDGMRLPLWNGNIKFVEDHLLDPLRWKKPRRIFVNSMSDLFHENVTDEMRDKIFAVMALCPQHTFQVLTKRPERMLAYCSDAVRRHISNESINMAEAGTVTMEDASRAIIAATGRWPLPNVHLGVSVEDQKTADERLDYLCELASLGWQTMVSFEPLLSAIDPGKWWLSLGSRTWAIVGGESGPGARPMHPDWARSLRDQCEAAGVPFFFKQWGEWKPICNMPEDEYNALYVSNKKAPELWQQDECDDLHGRRCTVPVAYLGYGGAPGLIDAYQSVDGHGGMMFFRIGKKAAGHLLDGKEYHQFPAAQR